MDSDIKEVLWTIVNQLARIADADERRNVLLEEDRAERRAYLASEAAERRAIVESLALPDEPGFRRAEQGAGRPRPHRARHRAATRPAPEIS